ncbi:MAG: conjugal transfer protein TraC [Micromonosporaceae bacterium]|nr:conjugal transfer protein TraC [Micromonosporaceae bacterium]
MLLGGPESVEVAGAQLRLGGDWCRTLAISGWPAEVGAGWLEPLLAYPGRVDVSLHVEPLAPAVAAERLRKQRGRLESSRRADASKGRLDDPSLEAAAADAAELAGRLARGEGRLFRCGLYLTVHAEDEQELADRVADVRSIASGMLLDAVPVTWRQLQGWVSSLPLAVDSVGMKRAFDTDALSAAFPFASPDLPITSSGMEVLYGLNLSSAGLVLWDRWAQHNFNSVILARSGAGKSYMAKLDLLRNLYLGVEAFVVDPDDEYLRLAQAVGGTIIRPGTPGVRINPLDIAGDGEPDALMRRALFVHTFVQVLTAGETGNAAPLPPEQAAALDSAVLAAYRDKGITTDARTWRRPAPLLSDLAHALEAHGQAGQTVAARLRPYVSGSFSGLFNGPTTHRPDGHLIVYAIKDLADELQPAGVLLILDTIWRRITATTTGEGVTVPRIVLVDEAWRLLRGGLGARFLFRLAKSARKYGAGLAVVTQDAADVLATEVGRAVVSNAATQLLMRQAPQAINDVAQAFGLTEGERAWLLEAGLGDVLLSAGTARVAFRSIASDVEHELVVNSPRFHTTGPTPT